MWAEKDNGGQVIGLPATISLAASFILRPPGSGELVLGHLAVHGPAQPSRDQALVAGPTWASAYSYMTRNATGE